MLCLCLLVPAVLGQNKAEKDDKVIFNFPTASLTKFIELISKHTEKTFLYDAGDRSFDQEMRIQMPKDSGITKKALFSFFESVLEMKGYTLVEFPEFTKIVKVSQSVPSDVSLLTPEEVAKLGGEERLVTMPIQLKHISAQEVISVLNGLKSKVGRIVKVSEYGILLYDYSSNIHNMMSILKTLDIKPEETVTKVLKLKHAQARDIQQLLSKIFQGTRRIGPKSKTAAVFQKVQMYADTRLNAIIVHGYSEEIAKIEELLAQLDIKPEVPQAEIHIMPLKNGDAEKIAKTLQDVYADKLKRTKGKGTEKDALDRIPSIVPHEGTNAIIVISPPDVFSELKSIVDEIDKKRDKVLIEALIVDLTYDRLHDFGVELASVKTSASADYNVFGGSLFGMSTPGFSTETNQFTRMPVPSNVSGMLGGVTYKNDFSQLPLLIVAAREDKDVKIYAQPQIVANNNEEATFESAVEVPTLKTNIGSGGEVISQSSEYHKASLSLKITPHITQEDYLRLEIDQATERFDLATALTNLPPQKTSRKANTVVTIPDRSTVLLGGLKSEDGSWQIKKVPLLGDLPLLRHLFRRKTWSESNSNVFVFISAYIIRSESDYERISSEKMQQIEVMKKLHRNFRNKKDTGS